MIQLHELSRSFGARRVVEALSFGVPTGRLCALLGPNGAGKTTTVRMLLGLLEPSSGRAVVAGVDLPGDPSAEAELRRRCGLLTETPGFYDRTTAQDNLRLFGGLYGLERQALDAAIEHHLRFMGLWDRRDDPVATWSKGMKQRLAIVRAMLHEPEVLFLDEPTAGLDPASARDVRELIASLKGKGRTILMCTHNLGEAEELADLVAVIQGSVLAFGAPDALTTGGQSGVEVELDTDAGPHTSLFDRQPWITGATARDHTLSVVFAGNQTNHTPAVVAALVQAGAGVLAVRPRRTSLEQVYLDAVRAEP